MVEGKWHVNTQYASGVIRKQNYSVFVEQLTKQLRQLKQNYNIFLEKLTKQLTAIQKAKRIMHALPFTTFLSWLSVACLKQKNGRLALVSNALRN